MFIHMSIHTCTHMSIKMLINRSNQISMFVKECKLSAKTIANVGLLLKIVNKPRCALVFTDISTFSHH